MTSKLYRCALILLLTSLLAAPVARAEADGWQSIVPGIDYQSFAFNSPDPLYPGPVRAYVARMDRNNPSVTLDSAIANGKISGSRQKVGDMAALYDEAINYWGDTWGGRNHVVVAINGGFFNLDTGVIQGGQIQSGWYAKRFDDYSGGSGFAWKLDRSAFIGQCVLHNPQKQMITYPNNHVQLFSGINIDRGDDQLILYTPQYDARTHTDNNGAEVLVELTTPSLIIPTPFYFTGHVSAIRDGQGSSLIPYDSVVLSASGAARAELISNAHLGEEIHISQEIAFLDHDCNYPQPPEPSFDWTRTYASIDGNKILLENGSIPTDLPVLGPDPRTAIAFNDNYIYYIVVDGRQPSFSIGLDLKYLGQFALDALGAVWAINQDGGGSSTMVINGQLMNLPSDGCPVLYLPFISRNSSTEQIETPAGGVQQVDLHPDEHGECQRPVANGMLMVQVEGALRSSRFTASSSVTTNQAAVLRLGPGSNYPAITTLPAGTQGVILPDINNLSGILAKGYYRWKVDFGGGNVGWVAEETIIPGNTEILPNQ